MTQRRPKGPRIQKVSAKWREVPKYDATLVRAQLESEPRTLIASACDSEPRTLIAREAFESDPRTLIAKPISEGNESESEPPASANGEGPATVLWTRASVEVRVRGLVTPPSGIPIPKPVPSTTLGGRDDPKQNARTIAKSAPLFLPKASASLPPPPLATPAPMPRAIDSRPAPVPSTLPLAHARPSQPPRTSSSPSAHVGLTPVQRLHMQQAQAQRMQASPVSQHPMSQHPAPPQHPMSQHPMSQHPAPQQHPMSQHPYSGHPSQRPGHMMQSGAPYGSIAPVAVDPSAVNVSFAPTMQPHAPPSSDAGTTIAKLAAALVLVAIGLFILRGALPFGSSANASADTTAPQSAAAQPQAAQVPPTQPMAVPSAWMAPTPVIIPPALVADPRAPAPQTVATTDPQAGAVVITKKKIVKKKVVAEPTAPAANPVAPAPVDLPGETPETTPVAPVPAPHPPAPAPVPAAAPGAPMKNMPTKVNAPTRNEGEAAQQTLDQAKFETTDAL